MSVEVEVCTVHVCHQQITIVLLGRHRRKMNLGPCSKNHGSFLRLQSGLALFKLMLMMKIQNLAEGS